MSEITEEPDGRFRFTSLIDGKKIELIFHSEREFSDLAIRDFVSLSGLMASIHEAVYPAKN